MATYLVKGGRQLSGVYEVSGAKNAGPKLIIAAMLSDKECVLRNIPRISDTEKIMSAIRLVGGQASWTGPHEVTVNCAGVSKSEVPTVVLSARHAVLFIGATLARLGKVRIAKIGGDKIGKRPIDRLLSGLENLGAEIKQGPGILDISMPERPVSRDYTFAKNTHTGTESLILGSIFNNGRVIIKNAAAEPEIDNLINFLNAMGAKVKRKGERVIEIIGVAKLLGEATGESMNDRLEAATAITLAALNGGKIKIKYNEPEMLRAYSNVLENIGITLKWSKKKVWADKINKSLTPITVKTAVYPGFMTDWQPIIVLLLVVKAHGRSEVLEMIYEKRWSALRELGKMGVKYELFQPEGYSASDYNFNEREYSLDEPYGAYVWGPTELKAAEVESHDVRAGICVLLAAIFAKGESVIKDPQDHIARGYENIIGKLTKLGADIKLLEN